MRPEDIVVRRGRAVGGDFLMIIHQPSGVSRRIGPPLVQMEKAQQEMIREIEVELIEKGLSTPTQTIAGHAAK